MPRPLRHGAKRSRGPSPRRLAARMISVIATPGYSTSYHGGVNDWAFCSPSMFPKLRIGGGTPTPR